MRELAAFDKNGTAETFAVVLSDRGIEVELNQGRDGQWRVWVLDDAELEAARELHQEFEKDPGSAEWAKAKKRAKKAERRETVAPEPAPVKLKGPPALVAGMGQSTLGLILLCIAVAILTELGAKDEATAHFTIASYVRDGDMVSWMGLADLQNFELWRLFSPMLVHFGFIHLIFNVWWLKDLGTAIEIERPRWFFPLMVLVISGLSNIAQYYWPPVSPTFGGMSGVVYGLLGYVWLRGKFDPRSRFQLAPGIVGFMLAWLVLCFTGLLGPVANGAHVAGLVIGCAWGYLGSGHLTRRR